MSPEEAQAPLRHLDSGAHLHMIGVAGAGMSALAAVLLARGFRLSGSDQQRSAAVDRLAGQGLVFFLGHDPANLAGADLVIISAAVREENPELAAARAAALPVVKRAAALGWLLEPLRAIAVAGTHGKTTTTAMVAVMLTQAGLAPTFVVGGEVLDLGASAAFGTGMWAAVEADEYDRSFLQLRPRVAVITNVETDHLEYYGSEAAMQQAYEQFVDRLLPGGTLVLNAGDAYLRGLAGRRPCRVVRCAAGQEAEWWADGIVEGPEGTDFALCYPGGRASVHLRLPGRHNVANAVQAMAAVAQAGVAPETAAAALAAFRGTGRRFQLVGEAAGILVLDDYAHHPTEIRATLAGARARFPGRRLVAVFQPHTYSRAKLLFDGFVGAFDEADLTVVTAIYASREQDTLGMGADRLAEALAARLGRSRVLLLEDLDQLPAALAPKLRAADVVLTLGAGSVTEVGPRLLARLSAPGGAGSA
jgi:UDP-N-acetylmuramate--alanine ligase